MSLSIIKLLTDNMSDMLLTVHSLICVVIPGSASSPMSSQTSPPVSPHLEYILPPCQPCLDTILYVILVWVSWRVVTRHLVVGSCVHSPRTFLLQEGDADLENAYYTAKQHKEDDPKEALAGFAKVHVCVSE